MINKKLKKMDSLCGNQKKPCSQLLFCAIMINLQSLFLWNTCGLTQSIHHICCSLIANCDTFDFFGWRSFIYNKINWTLGYDFMQKILLVYFMTSSWISCPYLFQVIFCGACFFVLHDFLHFKTCTQSVNISPWYPCFLLTIFIILLFLWLC
jgi:hypothetical protein